MSNTKTTDSDHSKETIAGVAVLAGLALLALPTVVIGAVITDAVLRHKPIRARAWQTVLLAGIGVAIVAAGVNYIDAIAGVWSAVRDAIEQERSPDLDAGDVAGVVLWGAVAGPLVGALGWRIALPLREADALHGRNAWEARRKAEAERWRRQVHHRQRIAYTPVVAGRLAGVRHVRAARARRQALPDLHRRGVIIGRAIAGDMLTAGKPVLLSRRLHYVVLGRTQHGKTELLMRRAEDAIERGEQVIYLNCKQPKDRATGPAARLADLAGKYDRTWRALSATEGGYWDPMRGTTDQQRARLMSVEVFTDPYYEAASTLLLELALKLAAAEGKPIQSVPALAWSLVNGRLVELAQSQPDPQVLQLVEMLGRAETAGAAMRWSAQAVRLGGWISEAGWGWEDADVIGVDLPTSTESDAARALLRAMLTDLEGWITDPERRPWTGRDQHGSIEYTGLCLIIDELGALDDDPVIMRRVLNLLERALGAGCTAILAAQDPGGLGDARAQSALLTNAGVITFQQADGEHVERLCRLAGSVTGIEASAQMDGLQRTGAGSARMQDQWSLHPNLVRELAPGECVLIDANRWVKVAVAMPSAAYRPVTPLHDLLVTPAADWGTAGAPAGVAAGGVRTPVDGRSGPLATTPLPGLPARRQSLSKNAGDGQEGDR